MDRTATAKIAATKMVMKREKEPWSPFSRETLKLSSRRSPMTRVLIQKAVAARNLVARRSIANATRAEYYALIDACVMGASIVMSIRNFQKVVLFH